MKPDFSLYFHIPFCIHRCAYCDFNTYAGMEDWIPFYVEALCKEIRLVAQSSTERINVHTLYFGGGTPSLLTSAQFESILKATQEAFTIQAGAEISLEANPGTVTAISLKDLHSLGFNRISLGVQSSHPEELQQLERIHDFYDVIHAVCWCRQAGFDNLNLDVIYGLPEQPLEKWKSSLKRVLDLHPDHLSLYSLTVEPQTPFGRWAQHGLLSMPDPDVAADMYEHAEEILDQAGLIHYEISNWAKPGKECRHNLQYWRAKPYLGFGAGAHGWGGGMRISNGVGIKRYIQRLEAGFRKGFIKFPVSPAAVNAKKISREVEMQEFMLTGLRLTEEGVLGKDFKNRFGMEMDEVFVKEISELTHQGLLEWDGSRLRLTKRGHLLGNQVFIRFVD